MEEQLTMKTAIEHFKERMNVSRTLCGSDFKIDFIRYLPDELGKSIAADAPKVVYEEGRKIWVSTKSAYAIQPGNDLAGVRAFLENELPGDFLEFYREIREGLLITLSHPIHFWSEERMLEKLDEMRHARNGPVRFLRFADYFDLEATQFALWQPTPTWPTWRVVTTSVERIDDFYDTAFVEDPNDVYVYAEDFTSWIKFLVETDGVDDPICRRYNIHSIFQDSAK
jgi:hypothetical protein